MKKFRLPPEKSPDEKVDEIFTEMGKILLVGFRDGSLDFDSEVWEQDYEPLQNAWLRLTVPSNLEALRRRIGTANNPDWEQMIQAAYRRSLERSHIH
jgi:hypothetical protein